MEEWSRLECVEQTPQCHFLDDCRNIVHPATDSSTPSQENHLLLLGRNGLSTTSTIQSPSVTMPNHAKRHVHSRSLGVLTSHSETPMVPQTTMRSNLLESLEIVSQFLVNGIGKSVRAFAIDEIFLSVEEPSGDLELGGVLHNGDDSLEFVRVELTGTDH